jgi:hypothetical protein
MRQRLEEMVEMQRAKLLKVAEEIVPYVTTDDILQPCDFKELEAHPYFRYEEGVLEGLQSALTACLMDGG